MHSIWSRIEFKQSNEYIISMDLRLTPPPSSPSTPLSKMFDTRGLIFYFYFLNMVICQNVVFFNKWKMFSICMTTLDSKLIDATNCQYVHTNSVHSNTSNLYVSFQIRQAVRKDIKTLFSRSRECCEHSRFNVTIAHGIYLSRKGPRAFERLYFVCLSSLHYRNQSSFFIS